MNKLGARDSRVIWHPYTPVKTAGEAIGVVRGYGAYLEDENGKQYLDAISSWWVNLHGHAHPYIAQKVAEQLGVLEHCIFAGFTHEPAVRLAERLLPLLPGHMERIFYSDNGSTAVEVALKMAIQYWKQTQAATETPRVRILALENAYHGDTFGAMAVSARGVFTAAFKHLLFDVSFLPFPAGGCEENCLAELRRQIDRGDVAALIVEPLVLGSGGMLMYSQAHLQAMFKICRDKGVIIIADEVLTGFGRTGALFATGLLETPPDIICLSKGITGGFFPMGATATNARIFSAFYDDDKTKMLYHGHSYTGNAAICAAALASLDLLLEPSCEAQRHMIAHAHGVFRSHIKDHTALREVRQTGTILAVEINSGQTHYHAAMRDFIYNFFIERGILMRPLGNIVYILPPYCINREQLEQLYGAIVDLLDHIASGRLGVS